MGDDIRWLINAISYVSVAVIGMIVGAFWKIANSLSRIKADNSDSISKVHRRIDDLGKTILTKDDIYRMMDKNAEQVNKSICQQTDMIRELKMDVKELSRHVSNLRDKKD